ncbi:MAG: reverse transcriptase/maturase family protein [Candidatus Shapirobacteria bacterium]|nr:reverse transcriptase/maturase family protein [Candidatus Shapirobacteria bacterium]
MRRHGSLYSKIVDIDNLRKAYLNAKKGKGWQNTVKNFEKNLEDNLLAIQKSLIDKTFTTSKYKIKTIKEPKRREIFILPFAPDRIIQHALMNILEPIWDSLFIFDSYACRKGKGIHKGSQRTMRAVRNNKYCLKMDISKFYPSMEHDILFKIVKKKIKCPDTLWLIKDIIYSIGNNKNVPIGNYTSQWFGNLYMNELDQFMKHNCKVKYYIRYCDDFCAYSNDLKQLHELRNIIEDFLKVELKLKFSKCDVFQVKQGVDFLGYRHFPNYILLRKSTAKRVKKRLIRMPKMLRLGLINKEQFRSSIASTWGWLKWADTYNLQFKYRLDELMQFSNNIN